ncbi:hypothetical protein FHG64_04260 [Antarcticibacterium flavum]|uniref:Uncharacterized protein n=1 Tax=Antarcticibacterium flavum TaxID=2058175 RepID=A0A5B7X214_9FLAO|nr:MULTISPECIES: hypothetical protein [Antarcticibacterium]MCM4160258.1 hypothetical protein [Antarcticibacterium sp. W02-3]QCY68668.1 hypothetical protein FHG64_04260 [Antarcticibacterium flavum]
MEATSPANSGNFYPAQDSSPVRTSEWFWTLFLTAIPLVGLIMLLVWAFGSGNNINKSSWAKATLLWILVVTGFYVLLFIIFGLSFLSAGNY